MIAVLQSSGTMKEFWNTTILKKVGAPAKHKISQEAISDKNVDKIMRDLALHFDCSHKIVANLTRLHVKAGHIPEPNQEPYSLHKVLIAHCEILTGASEFSNTVKNPISTPASIPSRN